MSKQSYVLSFDEASRTSYARAERSTRDSRSQGRYASESAPARNRSSRSYAYDSPLSWDSLSLRSASAYRTGVLRTAASESRPRDNQDYGFERRQRSSRRQSGHRYASPAASSKSTSGRLPSARFAREDDYTDERPRRVAEDERVHDDRRSERGQKSKLALIESLKQKRHAYRKAKAGKQFAAQFKDAPSDASQNAPRAAVYTGSLGTKQRQAMDMQHTQTRTSSSTRRTERDNKKTSWLDNIRSPKMLAIGIVTVCLIAACAFIYPSARQYYQTIRQNAQLEAEFEAIQERNAALQQDVDSLQSAEGVHDRAHELYGWVGADENSVLIQGLERSTEGKANGYQAAITPDSIPAPDTWYSPFLDWFFGYDNSPSN
ncbi:MAG: septum formation initiator family protein [Eggerthellaceae bacterium]|nr:septum formation initiator family protein [Eggerthellaceae bacterium]